MKCDAKDCGFPCEGKVKRYSAKNLNPYHDWGKFYYCDAHAEEDRRRGLTLVEINEKGKHVTNSRSRETIKELWETIEFLNCKLEQIMPTKHLPQVSGDLERDMVNLIKAGKVIYSVKFMRDATGCALKPAADTMRRLREEIWRGLHGEYNPNLVGKPPDNFFDDVEKSA